MWMDKCMGVQMCCYGAMHNSILHAEEFDSSHVGYIEWLKRYFQGTSGDESYFIRCRKGWFWFARVDHVSCMNCVHICIHL